MLSQKAYTRQLRAEFILELIQEYYTEQRILKIIGFNEEREEVPEEIQINTADAVGNILNDVTVGEYRVVVSSRHWVAAMRRRRSSSFVRRTEILNGRIAAVPPARGAAAAGGAAAMRVSGCEAGATAGFASGHVETLSAGVEVSLRWRPGHEERSDAKPARSS